MSDVKDIGDLVAKGIAPDFADAEDITTGPIETSASAPPRIETFLGKALDRISARRLGKEKPLPLPWPKLTSVLRGGLWPGAYVLVGNTGSGKTQFALQLGLHAAQQGFEVLYLGLELDEMQLVSRLIGLLSQCSPQSKDWLYWADVYYGQADPQLVTENAMRLKELPLRLQMAPPHGWHHKNLAATVAATRAAPDSKPGPMLVVLDFLQLVSGERHEDLRERISRAAYAGRTTSMAHNAAVLMLSSTARGYYNQLGGKEKELVPPNCEAGEFAGLGKESGDIEFASDGVFALARLNETKTWLALAKMRAGGKGWHEFDFNGAAGTFKEPGEPGERKVFSVGGPRK